MPNDISSIVLAAGASTRMGRIKQLLPIGDKSAIVRCVETNLMAGIKDTIVVISPNREISKAIEQFSVKKALNHSPKSEMVESVRIGLNAAAPSSQGIIIFPADYPLVSHYTLRKLIEVFQKKGDKIIIPLYHGKRGHPVLFPVSLLIHIYSGYNLREIIQRHRDNVTYYEVNDKAVVLDMDTEEDYRRICETYLENVK
jgi:molybdenum cofactor cytidylyltransferase